MTQNSDSEAFGPISDLIMELPKAPGLSLEVLYLDWGSGHTCLALREWADRNPPQYDAAAPIRSDTDQSDNFSRGIIYHLF